MIDPAMALELAEAWLDPYLEAEQMNPTHPHRDDAFEAADMQILDSYRSLDTSDWDPGTFTAETLNEATAQDVTTLLRGVAELIVERRRVEADR